MPDANEKLAEQLSAAERVVVSKLEKGKPVFFSKLLKFSGMKEIELMRALQWLSNKGIVEMEEQKKELISLGKNGLEYKSKGLPEKRLLKALKDHGDSSFQALMKNAGLNKDELNVSLGLLRKNALLELKKTKKGIVVSITPKGNSFIGKEAEEELFLKQQFPVAKESLKANLLEAYKSLSKRKGVLEKHIKKEYVIRLTKLGESLKLLKLDTEIIEKLTPEIIITKSWKGKSFKRYDVKAKVPKKYHGKRHFVNQAIEYARKVWIELGFKEMTGPILNTSFWNFDALFTAQDHPVRELQDTFFVKSPKKGKLPAKELVERVKAAHENGFNTGSTGWRYSWDKEKAKLNILRTHTTVLSARTIAAIKKEQLPVKYFAIGKCFRNETVDWCHAFEFNQTEGIVIDPNANFKHLLGYLKRFFAKLGFEKARFRPAYFPYTELSVEIDVFHPLHNKWVELGGAGIFRPEVVVPLLGIDVPVLAWGPGFDRLILDYYNITDIRELYKNDIKQLRETKEWIK